MGAVLTTSLADPTTGILALLGTVVITYGTVKVAQINRSEARPNPDAVPPALLPTELQARADAWREQTVAMIDRLVEAEGEIRTLKDADAAKDEQIRADAEQIRQDAAEIRTLTERCGDLVAYVRLLLAEIRRLHGHPPTPPASLDIDL